MASDSLRQRELEVAREIAHAFVTATQPLEVYRLALARVTPLVHAGFASVFLRDDDDTGLLRLVCAQNWPQDSARHLGRLRIRMGRGPTGQAAAEGRPVEARDVFADPDLSEWWEPARELGFASLIALPLQVQGVVAGALTFYFRAPHAIDEEERELLALIADQLAATVEKAHLIERLRRANRRLEEQNRELVHRVREAEEARRLKTEFLANMSHEFRTPLTAILGYAQILSTGHAGGMSGEQASAVGKIERAADVLLGLVTDLLQLSQLKLGRTEVEPRSEDAVRLARRAAAGVEPPPDGITFRVVGPEDGAPVRTDGEKVVTILENLLSNAFKFTAEGRVELRVRGADVAGSDVTWAVRDTGTGIRESEMETIFDEFRQVDGSITRPYGGTGLGLALSRRIARTLGGEITAESEFGRGSTFMLRLPRSGPPPGADGPDAVSGDPDAGRAAR